jgi:hypothetical protein
MERRGSTFTTVVRNGFLVIIFEFFGSLLLGIFQRMLEGIMMVMGIWVITAMGERISGSHYNPTVTLA